MPEIDINGIGRVRVSDDFVKLPADQQQATVEEIAGQLRARNVATDMQGGYVASAGRFLDNAARAIARGVTFGWADEISAKMDELTGRGGSYEENLAREKSRTESMSPFVRIPGEVGGAIAGTIAAAPVRGAVMTASGLSRVPALVRSVVGGAAGGALYGAEEAGPGNRLSGTTAEGAAFGAVAGPVGMAVARGAGGIARAVTSPTAAARADIARALARDEISPEHAQELGRVLGADRPGAILPDVAGENVKGLLERVAQTPGAGRTVVKPAMTARQEQQASRIADDLSELTGTKQSAFSAINETMQQRAAQAGPLYEQAYNWNGRADSEVMKVWNEVTSTGYGRQILNSGALKKTLQTQYGVKDITEVPQIVLMDMWKRSADDAAAAATRAGNRNAARTIAEMRDRVIDVVKEKNPAYQQALEAWSGKSRYLDAIEEGKDILSNKLSSEELTANFAKLSDSEKEGFRIGALSAIVGKLRSDPAKLADLTKSLRSAEMRDKVRTILPTPEAAAAWERRLNYEVKSSETVGQALRGSRTARVEAEMADAKSIAGDLVLGAIHGAPSQHAILRIFGSVLGPVKDTLRSRADKEIARMLTSPEALQRLPSVLQQ